MRTSLAVRAVRWLTIMGLATLVSVLAADVDPLVRVLRDPDKTADAKGDACLQLMDLGPAAAPAVPALVGLLTAPEEMLRDYAVTTLERIGPPARNALPALRRTLAKDTSPEIRELARAAIAKISSIAPASEPLTAMTTATPVAAEPAVAGPVVTAPVVVEPAVAAPAPEPAQTPVAVNPEALTTSPPDLLAPKPAPTSQRPVLEVHQGRYFRWAVPSDWAKKESSTDLTLTALNGTVSVSAAVFIQLHGRSTPADFTVRVLGRIPENKSIQVISKRDLPEQPSGIGLPWRLQELEMSYTVRGIPVHAIWTTGIVRDDDTYDAYILGYQGSVAAFDRAKVWLAPVAASVAVINPEEVAGDDKMRAPTLHLPDDPALLESWRAQGLYEHRIAKVQREGMLGYERIKDPRTGRLFELPLEAWDRAGGGYHNPLRPVEVLQSSEREEQ